MVDGERKKGREVDEKKEVKHGIGEEDEVNKHVLFFFCCYQISIQ